MIFHNHLRYAASIVKNYDGSKPLSLYLKTFFKANKQMGSRDRKTVSELVYGYYRLGHLNFDDIEERINASINKTDIAVDGLFPWTDYLSPDIDPKAFTNSFLIQPDLFIRIRPGYEKLVREKLEKANVEYYACDNNCIGMPNSTKVDQLLLLNREAVIQDKSSQQTGNLIKEIHVKTVWDCCAASGGKSLMATDMLKSIELTVSDIRNRILDNLKDRFATAGITSYQSFIADLTDKQDKIPQQQFDLIIADVPCSGSGTWSRTPENLFFFEQEKIDDFQQLQQAILSRVVPSVRKKGYLLYITCSAFARENEENIDWLLKNYKLNLLKKELIKGYQSKADTMFAALLQAAR